MGGSGGGGANITRTILENVRVLASGQKIEPDREGKPQTVAVITLLVSPDDATKLAMASTQGKIQLALRNTIDTKKNDPKPVLDVSIFSPEGAVTKPVRTAPGKRSAPTALPPYVIEVIT